MAARREAVLARAKTSEPSSNVIAIRPDYTELDGEHISEVRAIFCKLPPGMNPDVWYRVRQYNDSGLTAPPQRADTVFYLRHYFFNGDPSKLLPALGYGYEQEREWAIEQKHASHMPRHCISLTLV